MRAASRLAKHFANARWLVLNWDGSLAHFPLAEFCAFEGHLENWPHLAWADGVRWIQFGGPGLKGPWAALMRRVVGVARARPLENLNAVYKEEVEGPCLWDEGVRESHSSPALEGMPLGWDEWGVLEAQQRQKLPWEAASEWRLGVDGDGVFEIQHFKFASH